MISRLRIPSKAGIRYRIRRAAYWANRAAGRFDNRIWVLGDGRSGTTWLADLINFTGRYRLIFEPFHPVAEAGMKGFAAAPYVRPGGASPQLEAYFRHVFSGKFQSYRSEDFSKGWWFDGLLVKSIFANLFAGWAAELIPDTPRILILRHPCAVAESKCAIQTNWIVEPLQFWKQPELREDHLQPYETLIHETKDPFLKYIVCWAIEHSVLLPQVKRAGIHVVYYERLCVEPELELAGLFKHLSWEVDIPGDARLQRVFSEPSKTSRSGGVPSGDQRVSKWIGRVDKDKVRRAMEILETFGLGHVYDAGPLPLEPRLE